MYTIKVNALRHDSVLGRVWGSKETPLGTYTGRGGHSSGTSTRKLTIDCQQIGRRAHAIDLVIVSYKTRCMRFGLCSPFKGGRAGFARLS